MHIQLLEKSPDIQPEHLKYLKDAGHTIHEYENSGERNEVEAIIVRTRVVVDKNLIDSFPNLRYVCRVGVGLELIDQAYCEQQGIKVINTPGANAGAVADLALRGTLSLLRKTTIAANSLQIDRFEALGRSLSDCKIGLIGYGHVARKVHERLLGYGVVDINVYDPYVSEIKAAKKVETINDVTLNRDVVYIAVPLLEDTKNLINQTLLEKTEPDTIWINTSRGGIVDENAMYNFLSENRDAGYYADVRQNEPIMTESVQKLVTLSNCIITPHIGAITEGAQAQMHYFPALEKIAE